jgi:hypothetical protein
VRQGFVFTVICCTFATRLKEFYLCLIITRLKITEIVSRFDLVAIQEVSANMGGLEKLMELLGSNWDRVVTDSTDGRTGGGERMVFLYDGSKISFGKIIGD